MPISLDSLSSQYDALDCGRNTLPHQLANRLFDLIYIDGGHRYEQVLEDLAKYSRLVRPGGYLVLDDASCAQPGSRFLERTRKCVPGGRGLGLAGIHQCPQCGS